MPAPLPDPLAPDSPLLASVSEGERGPSANGNGGFFAAVQPSLNFVRGSDAASAARVDIDVLRAYCQTPAGILLIADIANDPLPAPGSGVQRDPATGQLYVLPAAGGYTYQMGSGGNVPADASVCWTEASVRITGQVGVQAANRFHAQFGLGASRLSVFGTSAWRTANGVTLNLRTGL